MFVPFRRAATKTQAIMVALISAVVALLVAFGVFEFQGVFSTRAEDTFSEWVWDQPFGVVLAVSIVFLLVGVLAVGSAWHFLEGYGRRRRIEKRAKALNAPSVDP